MLRLILNAFVIFMIFRFGSSIYLKRDRSYKVLGDAVVSGDDIHALGEDIITIVDYGSSKTTLSVYFRVPGGGAVSSCGISVKLLKSKTVDLKSVYLFKKMFKTINEKENDCIDVTDIAEKKKCVERIPHQCIIDGVDSAEISSLMEQIAKNGIYIVATAGERINAIKDYDDELFGDASSWAAVYKDFKDGFNKMRYGDSPVPEDAAEVVHRFILGGNFEGFFGLRAAYDELKREDLEGAELKRKLIFLEIGGASQQIAWFREPLVTGTTQLVEVTGDMDTHFPFKVYGTPPDKVNDQYPIANKLYASSTLGNGGNSIFNHLIEFAIENAKKKAAWSEDPKVAECPCIMGFSDSVHETNEEIKRTVISWDGIKEEIVFHPRDSLYTEKDRFVNEPFNVIKKNKEITDWIKSGGSVQSGGLTKCDDETKVCVLQTCVEFMTEMFKSAHDETTDRLNFGANFELTKEKLTEEKVELSGLIIVISRSGITNKYSGIQKFVPEEKRNYYEEVAGLVRFKKFEYFVDIAGLVCTRELDADFFKNVASSDFVLCAVLSEIVSILKDFVLKDAIEGKKESDPPVIESVYLGSFDYIDTSAQYFMDWKTAERNNWEGLTTDPLRFSVTGTHVAEDEPVKSGAGTHANEIFFEV